MRRVRYGGAMSLDGFIAGPNGEYDLIIMDPNCNFLPILFVAFILGGSSCESQQNSPKPGPIELIATSFTTDEEFVFDAKIVAPPRRDRNGYGVLMIGSGYGNDLDWSVPGFVEYQGKKNQITITGESHADAPLIAKSLAEHGFVVMHWTTIRRNDPKRDAGPDTFTAYTIKELLRFSKSALAAFRGTKMFEERKTILLGHSLGAVRAANIAFDDDQVDALVLLAPAQLTRTSATDRGRNENRNNAVEVIKLIDTDGDDACSPEEFSAWARAPANKNRSLTLQTFEQLDFHSDRQLVEWEVSAGLARDIRSAVGFEHLPLLDPSGLRWTEDILKTKKIDTLILYGALDNAQSHHAPIMSDLINIETLDHVKLKVVAGVGHQLGPEFNDLAGPISPQSRDIVAGWLETRASRPKGATR